MADTSSQESAKVTAANVLKKCWPGLKIPTDKKGENLQFLP